MDLIMSSAECWGCALVGVLAALDIIVGWLQAVVNKCFSSSKMRQGIINKGVEAVVIVLAIVLQTFSAHIGDIGWTIPLIIPVCAYLAVQEVASILENVKLANPLLADSPLFDLFNNDKKGA